ncbi:hypothetical protein [Massilia endophytica]|uniref:hypothetical protein n=1 Tax=Massilia endophytica TaxID=2899220 RepID=UPI001E5EA235|nr:hypothetical protein [Massilia endophytica]UGQ44964.1 hypothetical protein LSQ66_14275 [Massilia endophytica]
MIYSNTGAPVNKTATGVVATASAQLIGVFCASSSSGTLKLYDNASAASGTVVVNTFSLTAATFYPIPASLANGLHATIGGTADVTFFVA